jgi:tetratricopeptide (TPR) repeat protein
MGQPAPVHPDRRLDSWKEIAAFFGRDERTVRRWEKENALPVRRVPGGAKGRVFAYEAELREWLTTPQASERTAGPPGPPVGLPSPQLQLTQVRPDQTSPTLRFSRKWIPILAVCGMLVLAIIVYRKSHRFAVNASVVSAPVLPARESGKATTAEAEDFYLKGRYYWNKRTPDDLNKAVDYFTQAIVRDPGYAKAYVGLADCYNLLREYTVMPASEAYPRALAAARKAVELDDQSAAAHASLAFAMFFGKWEITNAEGEFRRAIDLDPRNATAHHWYANYLLTLRRLPESLAQIEQAQALDPSSTSILADKGNILFQSGRRVEAMTLLKQMELTEPAFRSPHLYLKYFYLAEADYPNFLAESKKDALLIRDGPALAIATAAEKGFAAGGAKAMFENMLQAQKKFYAQKLVPPTAMAQTSALLGHKEEALQYLQTAYDQHDELLLSLQNLIGLESLHDEPAYHALLAKMNLAS